MIHSQKREDTSKVVVRRCYFRLNKLRLIVSYHNKKTHLLVNGHITKVFKLSFGFFNHLFHISVMPKYCGLILVAGPKARLLLNKRELSPSSSHMNCVTRSGDRTYCGPDLTRTHQTELIQVTSHFSHHWSHHNKYSRFFSLHYCRQMCTLYHPIRCF